MEKNGLDWNQNLIGLQAHIINENTKPLYVWCHAHRFNFLILFSLIVFTV